MTQPQMDYHAILERVKARVEREKRRQRRSMVLLHAAVSLLLPFLLAMILPPGNAIILVVLVLSLVMGVVIHASSLRLDGGGYEKRNRERVQAEEIQAEVMRLGLMAPPESEKAKHMMRLSDDGELEAIVEPEAADAPAYAQRGQGQ
jgi:hypothetical protein